MSALGVGALGVFLGDPLLVGVCVALLVPLALGARSVVGDLQGVERDLTVEPSGFDATITRGEVCSASLHVSSGLGRWRLGSSLEGLSLGGGVLGAGEHAVGLSFRPVHFGEYRLDRLDLALGDGLGLLEAEGSVPFSLRVTVYPKTTVAVAEAARFLAGEDVYSLGEEPTRFRGSGFEYADTREYVRGDSLRRLDWKATAKLGRLMVKEFYAEGGMGVEIIYDARAPDPVSRDDLTEAFVRTALGFARRSTMIGIVVLDADGARMYPAMQPFDAVALAIRTALEENSPVTGYLYDLLDPGTGGRLEGFIEASSRVQPVMVPSLDAYEGRMIDLDEESRRLVILISCLQGDPVEVLYLNRALQAKGWDFEVVQPCRPWLWVGDLEESKRVSDRISRLYRVLEREAVRIETVEVSGETG